MENQKRVGFVVPTLGDRLETLDRTLASLKSVADAIVIVAPQKRWHQIKKLDNSVSCDFVEDDGKGLAAAINKGFWHLGPEFHLITWIGDDDGIYAEGFNNLVTKLRDSEFVAAFGHCDYVIQEGHKIGKSSAGKFAFKILSWGPDLIPQPGSLVKYEALERIGFLSEKYNLAFDFDMFLKLTKIGKILSIDEATGYFTWHSGSLSVSHRLPSAREAHSVRVENSHGFGKLLVFLAGPFVVTATVLAGYLLNLKVKILHKTGSFS